MRRLVTSDIQLSKNQRDHYRMIFFKDTLLSLVEKYKPDQLILAGDITEEKDEHPAPLVNEIVNAFYNLSKQCEIIVLQGNHDFLHNAHPFFEFLNKFANISWISKPTERDNCLYLPHTRDYKKDWAKVDFSKEYDFVFAHNIFTGVNAANGHALSGIPTNVFPDHLTCISGDVHEPQELADGKIIYVGSPCLCDHGDQYQPRVLLLDGLKIKSIKVHGQQKRLIHGHWPMGSAGFAHNANENDIVKINVHLTMKDVAEWTTIRQEVETWSIKNKFVLSGIYPIVAYVASERQKTIEGVKKTDEQYLTQFVARLGVDEQTADVGKTILNLP